MKSYMIALAAVAAITVPMAAQAAPGPATAALSQCLVASATPEDHVLMADWIFTVIARHPSVASMSNITDAQRTDINKRMGALFGRLMITACSQQVKAAVQQDGTNAIGSAFSGLGEAAMTDLMGDPHVQTAAGDFAQYFDEKGLEAALSSKTPTGN